MNDWQRGYSLKRLKAITAVLDEHDKGYVFSQFARTSERTVAEFLSGDGVLVDNPRTPKAVVLYRVNKVSRTLTDFSGAERAYTQVGSVAIKRIAGSPIPLVKLLNRANFGDAWLETWAGHPYDEEVLQRMGATYAFSKVRASSEIVSFSWVGAEPSIIPTDPAEEPGIVCVQDAPFRTARGVQLLEKTDSLVYADHYSVYGKGKSWGAIALRGYAPPRRLCDPSFIIKPGEMAKAWKAENPETLGWKPAWSSIGKRLMPVLQPFLSVLAKDDADLDRVRLMRLAPGGGELKRHADITDREAGVRDGMVMRFHFPLATNPQVQFNSWDLHGYPTLAHMGEGECWYLDVRKPHTAVNNGDTDRIHLVVDVRANKAIRKLVS